ncbi:MAG TPA: thiamine phosphate synthase [Actinomycetes bacterium]|jgi:thiamine-phosphate pyrophosphorylase|nr:thiamine phosphate synthase [Actinomycetes bacterium]
MEPGGGADGARRGTAGRLAAARLYLCTPIRPDLAAFADAVLGAGVDVVQLRDKQAEAVPLLEAAAVLREAADRHGALLAVNDRADVALAAGADILHLGQDDLPRAWAERILGQGVLLGRSTHDLEQAGRAVAEGWDYFAVGPVYPTATKPGRPATGVGLLRAVAGLDPPVPWFAIGGVGPDTLDEVLAAGATRAVVVRAITGTPDPAAAVAQLRTRLEAAATA